MRQFSTIDQMTQKLTTIGQGMAFNNGQSPYYIVSYKWPQNDNCKTIKRRKPRRNIVSLKLFSIHIALSDDCCYYPMKIFILQMRQNRNISSPEFVTVNPDFCVQLLLHFSHFKLKCDFDLCNIGQ